MKLLIKYKNYYINPTYIKYITNIEKFNGRSSFRVKFMGPTLDFIAFDFEGFDETLSEQIKLISLIDKYSNDNKSSYQGSGNY
jgi:hypothetical protein